MADAINNANKDGFLLPFQNGVLNVKTNQFSPHSLENYITHIIPTNYSKKDTIENTMFAD
jgi:phage/plasmid-associated DNA primase